MSVSVIEGSGLRRPRRIRPVPSRESSAPANHAPAPDDRPKGFREWGVAAGSSILLHLMLVLLLAAILIVLPGSGSVPVIQSAISAGDSLEEQLDNVEFETPVQETLALEGMEVSDAAVKLAGGDPVGRGSTGSKVKFFGTEESGKSFVFVVDASLSMGEVAQGNGPYRTRFMLALEELKKSLTGLETWQKFGIIFYNSGPIPLYVPQESAKLYPATVAERKKAMNWMDRLNLGSDTKPREALRQALELQPDVVFFLTDGEIPGDTRDVVMQANRYKTIVHTVGLSSRAGEAILQGIAEDNRGRYRYVP